MTQHPETYVVPDRVASGADGLLCNLDRYREAWMEAATNPSRFWLEQTTRRIHWQKEPTIGLEGSFHDIAESPIRWFADGELNVTESCLDRHLEHRADKVAILWEGDEPGLVRRLTYAQLHEKVCKTANALAELGLEKGDRAIIYMGMVPEAAIAMLACARLGAIHSVVFGGFSAEALRSRIEDCDAKLVITMDQGRRGGRNIPLKATTDEAVVALAKPPKVLVYKRTGGPIAWNAERDVWWHDVVDGASSHHDAVVCAAEDPLFILYTSGSTGKPKGVVHTCAGYLTWTAFTHREVFDLREDDVYACVADVGWITGHSYIVYGPLANGATTLMFESTPMYPDAGRYWDLVQRHKATIFYTAPTAIRALAACEEGLVDKYDLSSLRVLGTVGEPIDPESWRWYHDKIGKGQCTIVDTWWQTETGGISITPLASATPTKPGSATLPMVGIQPILLGEQDREIFGPGQGVLCLKQPWPGMARTIWGDHERYVQTYFSSFKPYYFTGDGCRRDDDGYHWITGRVDDVLNVSGHRMGTAEFEAALDAAPEVAEAAVVGFPHDIKGQGVYAYVVLQRGENPSDDLKTSLQRIVRTGIGAHARIDRFQFVPGLPKTRSGKVMRRILRKIAEGQPEALGDISTLADPSVVDAIKDGAQA